MATSAKRKFWKKCIDLAFVLRYFENEVQIVSVISDHYGFYFFREDMQGLPAHPLKLSHRGA